MVSVKKSVIAVVVTYNRKELLKECIEALLQQEYENFRILIIDNLSTDGTKEYINSYIDNKKILYRNTGANIGGAGGFNYGIKEAYKLNCDFVWLLDDDTIVQKNSLDELIKADEILDGKYGFLSSTTLWIDGTPCKMNKQKCTKDWYNYSQYLNKGILKIYHATFVSFFLKMDVIKLEGLPIKDFFIWGDDVEYSDRLAKKYNCYIVGKSIVVHKIHNNIGSNIAMDDKSRIQRYKYAYRNEVYIAKKSGIKGIFRQIAKIGLHIFRVIIKSKKYKFRKIGIILGSSIKGIFFNPRIEYFN